MLFELFLLILLMTLVVLSIRRGKHMVLDKPVVIHRAGQYHITLAPQLDRVQIFIELIVKKFLLSHPPQGELASQFFEVRDQSVLAGEGSVYLLAAAYRGGLLYFQAILPQPLLRDSDSYLKQVREFSEAVLALHPLVRPAAGYEAGKLRGAAVTAAHQLNIIVKVLTEAI